MTTDPSQPIDALPKDPSPEVVRNQQQAHAQQLSSLNEDLSFVALLSASASKTGTGENRLQTIQAYEAAQTPQTPTKEEESKPTSTEKERTHKQAATSTDTQGITPASTTSEVDEVSDMLVFDAKQLHYGDIKFLHQLAQHIPSPIHHLQLLLTNPNAQGNTAQFFKGLGISKGLGTMIEKAYKTQRPIRIEISETASIILRLGKDGKVSAEFLPNTHAAELYLKQSLLELQHRLESKQLPYGNLVVRSFKDPQHQQDHEDPR